MFKTSSFYYSPIELSHLHQTLILPWHAFIYLPNIHLGLPWPQLQYVTTQRNYTVVVMQRIPFHIITAWYILLNRKPYMIGLNHVPLLKTPSPRKSNQQRHKAKPNSIIQPNPQPHINPISIQPQHHQHFTLTSTKSSPPTAITFSSQIHDHNQLIHNSIKKS